MVGLVSCGHYRLGAFWQLNHFVFLQLFFSEMSVWVRRKGSREVRTSGSKDPWLSITKWLSDVTYIKILYSIVSNMMQCSLLHLVRLSRAGGGEGGSS